MASVVALPASPEIQHLVGPGADETTTECAAVQHNAEVAGPPADPI
jgi:hypothetical protein